MQPITGIMYSPAKGPVMQKVFPLHDIIILETYCGGDRPPQSKRHTVTWNSKVALREICHLAELVRNYDE